MSEVYYRVTFEDRGFFSAVHDLLDYLGDAAYDDFDEVAYGDIEKSVYDEVYKHVNKSDIKVDELIEKL